MVKGADSADTIATLLRRSADGERRLLKRERRAEREVVERRARLGEEQARLDRAQAQVERRRAELEEAEARLRERQAARAAGLDPIEAEAAPPPRAAVGPAHAADRRGAKTASRDRKTRREVEVAG